MYHFLVRTRIRLKLAAVHGKEKAKIRFDVCKLRSEEIMRRYYTEMPQRKLLEFQKSRASNG